MVTYKGKRKDKPSEQQEGWKETIINRIANGGRVVPIIGNTLTDDLAFEGHDNLVEYWAREKGYPNIEQNHDLPRIAQYVSITATVDGQIMDEVKVREDYLAFLKTLLFWIAEDDPQISADQQKELESQASELTVSELAGHLNYPSLSSAKENPLLLLADLPLPVYFTTSYHGFLEAALRKTHKNPRTEICRWQPDGLQHIRSVLEDDPDYLPSPEEPLVYHLHGFDKHPESLVLTEDDHLDLLTNISNITNGWIMERLNLSSLIMLGYSLRSWDFRVLFRGVLKARPQKLWKSSVAIQLDDDERESKFLKKYLRLMKFEVKWMEPDAFIKKLYQAWKDR